MTLSKLKIDNILLDGKSSENNRIYDNSYKTLVGTKHLLIMVDKIERFIRDSDGTKYYP